MTQSSQSTRTPLSPHAQFHDQVYLSTIRMNVSATLNAFRLLRNPSLCLPHATISTFNDLPVPLSNAFGNADADIRAVVLDKDNCFAVPKENVVYKPYNVGCAPLICHWSLFQHGVFLRRFSIHTSLRSCNTEWTVLAQDDLMFSTHYGSGRSWFLIHS